MSTLGLPFGAIRQAMAEFDLAPHIAPNTPIAPEQAFFPSGHRGVLDLNRPLVVGNRGVGKSFWAHALSNKELRDKLADRYSLAQLKSTHVKIGFNGSDSLGEFTPAVDEIAHLATLASNPDLIWKAVLLRIATSMTGEANLSLEAALNRLQSDSTYYSVILSKLDRHLAEKNEYLLIVFDALDRLGQDWEKIRQLSRALLRLAIGLQSFRSIRAKIFIRVDQFSDPELFKFPDSSKIKNDHVNLVWKSEELYGLLLFEILRSPSARNQITDVANSLNAVAALPLNGVDVSNHLNSQRLLVEALAGEFMGSDKKRGQVYTWVPLHLSDAASTCSPRTFLTAWNKAALHTPAPEHRAVDHLGLQEGVRLASNVRLNELYEDYDWIRPSLKALQQQFVPMPREQLFELWQQGEVLNAISNSESAQIQRIPSNLSEVGTNLANVDTYDALLRAMETVAVLEVRGNGKIDVPDIFRVDAGILRRGGVAVPKRKK